MNTHRRFAVAALVAILLAAIIGVGAQTGQQPTFRAGVISVRVDVYPTAKGQPVGDLKQEDFDVLEDGVPQAVATFEHVSARAGTASSERVEPRNTREMDQMVADMRNRLFVIFLDTYHVTDPAAAHNGSFRRPGPTTERRSVATKKDLGPRPIDKAIVNFLDRAMAPGDLVAAASPELDPRQLTFTRRPNSFEEWVATKWARRFSWDDLDPDEEKFGLCYPPDSAGDPCGCYKGIFEEMVLRRREDLTMRALHALVDKLETLREGRKAVLLVSEGWAMYRENRQLSRPVPRVSVPGCPPVLPTGRGVYVGAGGSPGIGTDPRTIGPGGDFQACESSRVQLAALDDYRAYQELLDEANRANVTFYPIDPRGLAVQDSPVDAVPPGDMQAARPPDMLTDQATLRARLETLRDLAAATDGRMTETNDLNAGMKKIADDLSEYYLLGYNSTNAKADGKFRKITVRVKRPGVDVRARRGYRAPTEEEVRIRARAEAAMDPEAAVRAAALGVLDAARSDRPLHLAAGVLPVAAGSVSSPVGLGSSDPGRPLLWIAGELDLAAARDPDWAQGQATITVLSQAGSTVASEHATVSAASRAFVVRVPATAIEPGEYLVRVRLQGRQGSLAETGEQVKVVVPEPAAASRPGEPLLFRRGPYTGVAYQQTADLRFRKAERVRVDVPVLLPPDATTGRVLDRNGRALSVPVTMGLREEAGARFVTAEIMLAPLAPGDYLIEVSAKYGDREQKVLAAVRVVPM